METEPQRGVLDGIELRRRNLAEFFQLRIERLGARRYRLDQLLEIVAIDTLRFGIFRELPVRVLPGSGIDLQLIQGLQGESA